MKLLAVHVVRAVNDLFRSGTRSGRWWLPAVILVLATAAVLAAAVQVAVPSTVYVFF